MFWKIEETPMKAASYSIEDLQCEENYAKTITRDTTGRFTTKTELYVGKLTKRNHVQIAQHSK